MSIGKLPTVAGAAGGISPYIVKLATELLQNKPHDEIANHIQLTFSIGLLLIAGIGGVVVFFFREEDLRKAFFLGISAPALITVAFSSSSGSTKDDQVRTKGNTGITFISSAYADSLPTPTAPAPNPGGTIFIYSYKSNTDFTVVFLSDQNANLSKQVIPVGQTAEITVPNDAAKVRFVAGDQKSGDYPLSEGPGQAFRVTVAAQRQFGLLQAFGQSPTIENQFTVEMYNLQAASVGVTGWMWAAKLQGKYWKSYLNLPSDRPPTVGETAKVIDPVYIREFPTMDSKPISFTQQPQEVKILELKAYQEGKVYWARIEVVN
jgi:hypothetical protein